MRSSNNDETNKNAEKVDKTTNESNNSRVICVGQPEYYYSTHKKCSLAFLVARAPLLLGSCQSDVGRLINGTRSKLGSGGEKASPAF